MTQQELEDRVTELEKNVEVIGSTLREFFDKMYEVAEPVVRDSRCPPMCGPTPLADA